MSNNRSDWSHRGPAPPVQRECLTRVVGKVGGRRRGREGVTYPLPSFLPSLLFSVSVFGTGKRASKERKVGRAEEIKKCYRVAVAEVQWRRGSDRAQLERTNSRLNDLPFTVRSQRPRVTLSFTAQVRPAPPRPRPLVRTLAPSIVR